MQTLFEIVHEDDELLVINKPAGLVCHPTKGDAYSSLISRVRLHLGQEAHPQLVNRLDRETSGLVMIAKTETAARELRKLWEARTVVKTYWAIVHGWVERESGSIEAALGKDAASIIAIKDCVTADGAAARTDYAVERKFVRDGKEYSYLRVNPFTGRKHQIRIHLAHIGHPIVGDKLYGGDEDLYLALVQDRLTEEQRARLVFAQQALHAGELSFNWRGEERTFKAQAEAWFRNYVAD